MFKSIISGLLLLGAAVLWPASNQAAGECGVTTTGSCAISSPIYALREARSAGGVTDFPFTDSATLICNMDAGGDRWLKWNDNFSRGGSSASGKLAVTLTLSPAQPVQLAGFSHVDLFSQFGTRFVDNSGYEHWVTVIPEPPTAWLLALSLLVVALRRMSARFASNVWQVGSKDLAGAAAWDRNQRQPVIAAATTVSP